MATTLELDHVSLFVRDLDTSARFYSEVLGFLRSRKRPHARMSAGSDLARVVPSI